MKLKIVGGGGFRVPLVYRALTAGSPITEVVLHDVAPDRLAAIGAVLAEIAAAAPGAPPVRTTTDLDAALAGARFVLTRARVTARAPPEGRTRAISESPSATGWRGWDPVAQSTVSNAPTGTRAHSLPSAPGPAPRLPRP